MDDNCHKSDVERHTRGHGQGWLGVVLVLAVWAIFWWPAIAGVERLYARDLDTFAGPVRSETLARLLSGELPEWSERSGAGLPHLADPSTQSLYPLNLVVALTDTAEAANTWSALLHSLLGMLFFLALARALGARPISAAGIAGVYGLSGYVLGITDNLTYLPAVTWVPAGLAACLHLRDGADSAARLRGGLGVAAATLALVLAGDPLNPAVLALACALLMATETSARGTARRLGLLALAMTLGAAAGAMQILPALDLLLASTRGGGLSYEEAASWSLPPLRLLELAHPFLLGSRFPVFDFLAPELYPAAGEPWADSIYLGVVPLGLAALAVSRAAGRPWAILLALTVAASLGRHLPAAEWLFEHAGALTRQRYPEKLVFWVTVALAALAASGAARLERRTPRPRPASFARAALSLGGPFLVLLLAGYWALAGGIGDAAWRPSVLWSALLARPVRHIDGVLVHGLALAAAVSVGLLATRRRPRTLAAVLLAIAVTDLAWIHRLHPPSAPAAAFAPRELGLAEALGAGQPPVRVLYEPPARRGEIPYGAGRVASTTAAALGPGDPYARGYLPIYAMRYRRERLFPLSGASAGIAYFNDEQSPIRPARHAAYAARLADPNRAVAALRHAGVAYVLTEASRAAHWIPAGLRRAGADPELGLLVLEVPEPAPRFRLQRCGDDGCRLDRTPVETHSVRAERVSLTWSAAPVRRRLVTTTSYSPGWTAEVDGVPVPIRLAEERFLALELPPSASAARLEYRTPGLAAGAIVSGLAALLALGLLLASVRYSRSSFFSR